MNSPWVGLFFHHQRRAQCQRGIRSCGAASQRCFSLVEAADSSHIQLCVLNWVTSSKLLPPPHLVWAPSRLSVTDNNLTGPSRNAHFSHHLHPPTPTPAPAHATPGSPFPASRKLPLGRWIFGKEKQRKNHIELHSQTDPSELPALL